MKKDSIADRANDLKESAELADFVVDFMTSTPKTWQKGNPPDWLFRIGLGLIRKGWKKTPPRER